MRGMAVVLAVVIGLVVGAASASAEGPSPWMGTVHVGYTKIVESSEKALYGVPGGGLALHGNLFRMVSPVLGVGAELGYQHYGEEPYELAWVPPSTPGEKGDAGFSSVHFTAQGVARSNQGKVRPYGTLGAGFYSLRATLSAQLLYEDGTPIPGNTIEDKQRKGKFGGNLGGGVQFKLSESSVSFGVEARWTMIFDAWPTVEGTSTMDVMTLTAGVHFN